MVADLWPVPAARGGGGHQVVQAEGEGHQGPVRLVAAGVGQGSAPKVVGKDVGPWDVP